MTVSVVSPIYAPVAQTSPAKLPPPPPVPAQGPLLTIDDLRFLDHFMGLKLCPPPDLRGVPEPIDEIGTSKRRAA